jgi:hypothetical protein
MLILTAGNIAGDGKLSDEKGFAKYDVWVGVNHQQIWAGKIDEHLRSNGASGLLRAIADAIDSKQSEYLKPGPVEEAIRRIQKVPQCPQCGSKKLSCRDGHTWNIE